jgi:type VI secretion system protein VasD
MGSTVRNFSTGRALPLLVVLIAGISGCSTLGKLGQIILNPDIQVGDTQSQPSTLGIALLAEPKVNPDSSGNGQPIAVQIVQLAEESRLLASDYDQIRRDLPAALGKNYLDHQDYSLLPGQFRYLSASPLSAQTRYLGVIAHYADPEQAQWRQLIRLDPLGHHYQLLVQLQSHTIHLQRDEE